MEEFDFECYEGNDKPNIAKCKCCGADSQFVKAFSKMLSSNRKNHIGQYYQVRCTKCGSYTNLIGGTVFDVIYKWNRINKE